MRYSSALLPTLKEAPQDTSSISHILLHRAGYMRRVGAGIYSFLPLGLRVLRKIEGIVREEMDASGAQEVLLPALLPADYFKETGRWESFGDNLLRLEDRKGAEYHLGPTHEEIITDMVRREIRSYRDLPLNLYQVQTKYRDEPRPRGGLLRGREFLMKDAYSFDIDEAGALASYEQMRQAYTRIFDRMGFDYRMVSADSGQMGGSASAEFQILVHSGEDILAACRQCQYAANLEVAEASATASIPTVSGDLAAVESVATPGKKTIEEVSGFLGKSPDCFLKSLVYMADTKPVMVVIRGDHDVNEVKLAKTLGVSELRLAGPEEVVQVTGAPVGFAGPIGFQGTILVDPDAARISDGIAGANAKDEHVIHVRYGRDYQGDVAPLRNVQEADPCPKCDGSLSLYRGIEAGHIFILGTHYSDKMSALYRAQDGNERPVVMGCYGIGISRLVAAAVEQNHDDSGILWPMSIAPYQVHIVQLGSSDVVIEASRQLEQALEAQGIDVLVDDRDERPGVKFKDADLLGMPLRVTVGERGLKQGAVELKPRTESDPKKAQLVPLAEAADKLLELIRKS